MILRVILRNRILILYELYVCLFRSETKLLLTPSYSNVIKGLSLNF